jgi:hypothetical protein
VLARLVFTGTSAGESANAGMPYRGMMPVAATATANPLLSFCRNLVVSLLVDRVKAGPESKELVQDRTGPQPVGRCTDNG